MKLQITIPDAGSVTLQSSLFTQQQIGLILCALLPALYEVDHATAMALRVHTVRSIGVRNSNREREPHDAHQMYKSSDSSCEYRNASYGDGQPDSSPVAGCIRAPHPKQHQRERYNSP